MKKMYISIHGIHDVMIFVQEALKVNGDVVCTRGRYTVDGKSTMGMFSIDLSEGVMVEYPEDAVEFENFIIQFKD